MIVVDCVNRQLSTALRVKMRDKQGGFMRWTDLVLPGKVLPHACEEGLREEEARDPKCRRRALFKPAIASE